MFPENPSRFDSRIHAGLSELSTLYQELDQCMSRALALRPLACPPGCTSCCQVPQARVEAGVLEMLPLAMEAWETGKAADLLASTADPETPCALLGRDSKGRGRCIAYSWRPLTCRLFGYSVISDTRNRSMLYTCGILKSGVEGKAWQEALEWGDKASMAGTGEASGVPEEGLPLAVAWRLQANNLNPRYSLPLLGINDALREALGLAGLRFRYGRQGAEE